jgi:glycosyltransferase involved in cell wall biosynthesis
MKIKESVSSADKCSNYSTDRYLRVLLPITSGEFLLQFSHWRDITKYLSGIFHYVILLIDAFVSINNNVITKTIRLPFRIRGHRILRYLYTVIYTLWGVSNMSRYDLIIALSGGPASISALLLKVFTKKPLITIIRTDFTEYRTYKALSLFDKILFLLQDIITRQLLRRSDKVISIYEHLYFIARSANIPKEKIKLIYIPVDEKFFKCKYKSKNSNEFIVGFVGRFSYENGSDLFIKVAKCVYRHDPSIRFLFVGYIPSDISIPSNVTATRYVEHNKVPDYLSQIDIFLSIKRSKGIPVAVIEALACGIPFAGINITDRIVSDAGILIHNNYYNNDEINLVDILCQLILDLKNNREKLRHLSINAKSIAQRYFTAQRFIHSFNAIISEIF